MVYGVEGAFDVQVHNPFILPAILLTTLTGLMGAVVRTVAQRAFCEHYIVAWLQIRFDYLLRYSVAYSGYA